jgi:UDP-N-acetylmuramate--alanine ligase
MMQDFVKRVHFVGIGGVGMSGIAQVLLNLGFKVSGSDLKMTELTRRLKAAGARVAVGHAAKNIRGAQVVVVSSAVGAHNPECVAARKAGIPVVQRAEMLAELARQKKTVTVSGTHGKTTTTAMSAIALEAVGADPTMVVGGQVAQIGSNARLGLGPYLVCEADESDGSFLRLPALVTVVTNIDSDHLDYYGGLPQLRQAFLSHIQSLPFYGTAVLCVDDPEVRKLLPKVTRPQATYGFRREAHWRGKRLADGRLAVYRGSRKIGTLRLALPGRHNALNALAAIAVCGALGFSVKNALKALATFRGVGRRMESLGAAGGVEFYDDYGHHPTEVRATLQALRELFPKRRLHVFFQPHRYSRTKALHREFGPALKGADRLYVLPVYAAGEKQPRGVDAGLIVRAAKRSGIAAQEFTRVVDIVRELRKGDVVLTLGAGDVWKTGVDLKRRLGGSTLGVV